MFKNRAIVRMLRCRRPLFAKVTGQGENLSDGRAQHGLDAWEVSFDPRRKRETGFCRPVHVYKGNVNAVLPTAETFTCFVVGDRFHYSIATLTQVFGERMSHQHIVLHDQNRCCCHAAL